MRRVTPHLLAVEDVEGAEAGDGFLAHAAERDVDDLFAVLAGEAAEAGTGWSVAEKCDMAVFAVMAARGEEAFFECVGEVEPGVLPDVSDWSRWKEEEAAAVGRLTNAGADDLAERIRRKEGECRLVFMFGVPGHPPGELARVSRGLKEHDDTVEVAAGWR